MVALLIHCDTIGDSYLQIVTKLKKREGGCMKIGVEQVGDSPEEEKVTNQAYSFRDLVGWVSDLSRESVGLSQRLRTDARNNYGVGEELTPNELQEIQVQLENIQRELREVVAQEFVTTLADLGLIGHLGRFPGESTLRRIEEELGAINEWLKGVDSE